MQLPLRNNFSIVLIITPGHTSAYISDTNCIKRVHDLRNNIAELFAISTGKCYVMFVCVN